MTKALNPDNWRAVRALLLAWGDAWLTAAGATAIRVEQTGIPVPAWRMRALLQELSRPSFARCLPPLVESRKRGRAGFEYRPLAEPVTLVRFGTDHAMGALAILVGDGVTEQWHRQRMAAHWGRREAHLVAERHAKTDAERAAWRAKAANEWREWRRHQIAADALADGSNARRLLARVRFDREIRRAA